MSTQRSRLRPRVATQAADSVVTRIAALRITIELDRRREHDAVHQIQCSGENP